MLRNLNPYKKLKSKNSRKKIKLTLLFFRSIPEAAITSPVV